MMKFNENLKNLEKEKRKPFGEPGNPGGEPGSLEDHPAIPPLYIIYIMYI